ncbi:hypothetical protein A9R05_41905 (plasmid) [Burkholderia sp. KK1]|uniref:hypothetical protein n=1 Tax=Burkholderia sp. M701 TaxID=326454 RepID=UPI0009799ABC|nr:hypothetical protein [Burkholderia sp. M701]AQH05581.1 hypothetical protein A9R05_41905 [Burkholderia sp. KK1]
MSVEQLLDVADNLVMLANSANDTRRRNVEQAASVAEPCGAAGGFDRYISSSRVSDGCAN